MPKTCWKSEAMLKCKISYVSLMVKDAAVVRKDKLHRNSTKRRRLLLRMMSSKNLKGVAKAKAKAKARPKKKAKTSELPPHGYQSWPMMLPFDMFTELMRAGLADRLWPGSN